MTTHRSGPKGYRQDLSFLSRLMWCCRKRNCPRGGSQGACFCRAVEAGGRVSRCRGQKRLGRDRLALAGSRSARGGFCVRPGAGGEEA